MIQTVLLFILGLILRTVLGTILIHIVIILARAMILRTILIRHVCEPPKSD